MPITTQTKGTLEYLTAQDISVPHGFTTRYGGVSTGTQASLNLAFGRGDTMEHVEENIRRLSQAVGFDHTRMVLTRQTHTNWVRAVTEKDCNGLCHKNYPECDALVTNTPGLTLMIFTADCTPILLWDPETGAVGAAHAGWKGTALGIAAKTVEAMCSHYGCDPANIRAAIGPNIAACHFETDADVPNALRHAFGPEADRYIRQQGDKFFPDLKAVNAMVLRRAGVRHMEISDVCTFCQCDRFWSHRASHGERGSQGAVITCMEACK